MVFGVAFLFVIASFQIHSLALNIDLINSIEYQSQDANSLFGYSVKIYSDSKYPPTLIIGAPRSEGSSFVPHTGNVFSCSSHNSSICSPLFLTGLNTSNQIIVGTGETGSYIAERKDDMWLGVSIETSVNGWLITCGHRYIVTGNGNNAFMHGQCHLFSSLTQNSTIIQPCHSCNSFTYYQCLAGLGLSINSDGSTPLIGIPGAKLFTGEVLYSDFDSCTSLFSPNNLHSNNIGEDALFGYSIARGRVINGNFEDIITSMPRYDNLHGGIAIFRNESGNFNERIIFSGNHFGGYFGHSVITGDLNGDGIDEIIVGIPNYSSSPVTEVGLVQIFFYDPLISDFINISIDNPDPMKFSKFGFSLANLGDLNQNGGSEFAIGAPFGSNLGVVYIFTWSELQSKPILYQRIEGKSISSLNNLSSFGYSLSPGFDVDGNNYEDVLIGAPLSGSAYFLRTFPVIRLQLQFSFNIEHIFTKNADTCDIELNGVFSKSICFQMEVLLSFVGKNTPNISTVSVKLLLDNLLYQRNSHFRVFFVTDGIKTNSLQISDLMIEKGSPKVLVSRMIYVEQNPVDLFTPVAFSATVIEPIPASSQYYFQNVKILGDTNFSTNLEIRNFNCGSDNICESDLVVEGNVSFHQDQFQDSYYPEFIKNEIKLLMLYFTIINLKEEALSPIFYLSLPPAVYFNRIKEQDFRIHNETTFPNHSSLILIDLTTSLVQDESISITILLSTSSFVSLFENFTINFLVRSVNFESPNLLFDNSGYFFVQLRRSALLQLQSFLQTDQVYYNVSNPLDISNIQAYNVEAIGNEVIHSYSLNNLKSSNVTQLRINFHWPLGNIVSNRFLLYLFSLQYDPSPALIRCDERYLNFLNLSSQEALLPNTRSIRSSNQYTLFKRSTLPLSNRFDCDSNPEYCVIVSCRVFNLPPSEAITFTLKARVFEPTLIELSSTPVEWYFTTKVSLDIIEAGVDYLSTIPTNMNIHLVTHVSPEDINLTYFVLQWYHIIPIILAILVPCALFIVTFIGLYFCGFFKIRKRGRQDIHATTDEEYEEELSEFSLTTGTKEVPNLVL